MTSPPATEFTFTCKLCEVRESWTNEVAAEAAASWHVHDHHPDEWSRVIGERPPREPLPHTLGRRFEDWELQS